MQPENKQFQGITLLGLGPGDAGQLTRQAWQWLTTCGEVYVRTRQHPTVADLPEGLTIHSFDEIYEHGERFEEVYEQIIEKVLELGKRPGGVSYAVPGHPFVAETTGPEIARRAKEQGIPLQVIEAVSFIEPTFTALGIDPFPQVALIDAMDLCRLHHPHFPPSQPALVAQIYNRQVASDVKLTLNAVYPDDYAVRLVHAAGTDQQVVEDLMLYEIDRSPHIGLLTSLYLPAMSADSAFEDFQNIVARLRAPDGCPWDRKQTHASLRKYLLEETYEALDALDRENMDDLCEELGDLVLQICLHAQIAVEDGEFSMVDVMQGINRKIVFRHPHVFGDVQVDGVGGVLTNWDRLKAEERKANGEEEKGRLDGVALALPALSQAQEIQERAARVGFDWPEIAPVLDKVMEELQEVHEAQDDAHRAEELGDLLFAVVNLVRWYKVDSESALRMTNLKFRRRFGHIEKKAREAGKDLKDMTLAEMDMWWDEAKGMEPGKE